MGGEEWLCCIRNAVLKKNNAENELGMALDLNTQNWYIFFNTLLFF